MLNDMKYFLRRRVHTSWQIAAGCVMIFVGVAAKSSSFVSVGWLLAGVVLLVVASVGQRMAFLSLALIGGLLIGCWRSSVGLEAVYTYRGLEGKSVILHGVVAGDATESRQHTTTFELKNVSLRERSLPGKVWVTLTSKHTLERSDEVTIRGVLKPGFGAYAATMSSAKLEKVVRLEPGDVALHVRDWFAGKVRQAIPEPGASLGLGFLVGQQSILPNSLILALKAAGLTHIVVASGYNVTILVRLGRRLFARTSKYLATLVSSALIVSFIAITGVSPSMARAGFIGFISLLAWYYGRKIHPFVLLALAVAVTVLVNPSYAWGDIGWQLSFAAFAGVMIMAPLMQAYFFGDKKPNTIRQILGETLAAWLWTLPILIMSFGYMSNVAIVANLMILPLMPLVMLLTFIAGITAIVLPVFASYIGLPADWLLTYMVKITEFFAGLSWAKTDISLTPWATLCCYMLLAGICYFMWQKTRFNLRESNIVQ